MNLSLDVGDSECVTDYAVVGVRDFLLPDTFVETYPVVDLECML